jgi:hypothetical protein
LDVFTHARAEEFVTHASQLAPCKSFSSRHFKIFFILISTLLVPPKIQTTNLVGSFPCNYIIIDSTTPRFDNSKTSTTYVIWSCVLFFRA